MTKQWLITELYLTQYKATVTDYRGHRRTLLSAQEINLKACAPEVRTRNLPDSRGIEPRLLR